MYNIPYFKDKDSATVMAFMQQHPFAMLIGCSDSGPVATQVPLLLEETEEALFLYGHIMRKTDHHMAFEKNNRVLCVFTGAHAYVSASWYAQPQTASTWNYMSVQARGVMEFLPEEALRDLLEKTTALFENNPDSPASFHHLPEDYVNRLMKAIVGFRIQVQSLEHTFKLSQNRDEASYQHIIEQLDQQDGSAQTIAAEMRNRASGLFPKQR